MTLRHGMAGAIVIPAMILMAACGSGNTVPTSPSATGLSTVPALAGQPPALGAAITSPTLPAVSVTLKAAAPVAQSPASNTILRNRTLQLTVENPVATFVPAALMVTFELFKITGGTPVSVHTASVWTGQPNTSITVPPAMLDDVQEYAWRAYASLDGATGPPSTPRAFQTEFVVILPPTLLSPIGGETPTTYQPQLKVQNGDVQGDAGTVTYEFELDTNSSFSDPVRVESVRAGGTGDTTIGTLPAELPELTTYSWRVRGTNGTITSEWSTTETFTTPDMTADQIDPSQITWLHTDVSDWEINSTVTDVRVTTNQVCIFHTAAGQWPFSTSIFDDGAPIEGNIWIFAEFNGRWYGATWDWLRPGQQCKSERAGAFGDEQIRIPPMDSSWVPRTGDRIGFMMSTIARAQAGSAGEFRTNIVVRDWP